MLWDEVARRAFGQSGGNGQPVGESTEPPARPTEPRLGIALGGGAARGWAHIGVMRALTEAGVKPEIIAGTSIGALVGGCYAAGALDALEEFARSLTKRRVLGLLDVHFGGSGLIGGERLKVLLNQHLPDVRIENLDLRFAAIATEFGSGHEVWLTQGLLIDAMRASYALPGILDPIMLGGRLLMDGALVNPIPITAARALGADIVMCVNLNGDVKSRGTTIQFFGASPEPIANEGMAKVAEKAQRQGLFGAAQMLWPFVSKPNGAPGMATVMIDAFNITQDRIARSRLAGDPPDVMVAPRLGKVGLFDFHRAADAIQLGYESTMRTIDELQDVLAMARR